MNNRIILHVDLDAFFAAVEQQDNPTLRGKPVIVAGSTSRRGVVSTASYEARNYGVHSAQPVWKARELCPGGIFIKGRMRRYQAVSRELYSILESYSPVLEQVSIDEAFLDITGCTHLYGGSRQTGRALQEHIKKETGLSCSVGIAPTKLVAKIASDLRKPGGLVLVETGEEERFLVELPIHRLPGVGKAMEHKLQEMGIFTVHQLRGLSRFYLRRRFGKKGEQLYEYARGIDNRAVSSERVRKSISSEVTFAENIRQGESLRKALQKLCADITHRLWRENVWANTIEVKVRFADFVTVARSCTLPCPTRRFLDLSRQAQMLLNTRFNLANRSIRLLGVSVSRLDHNQQLHFFTSDGDDSLSQAVADLRAKFGPDSVRRGL